PGAIRSLIPSATLRGAATPPWTPSHSGARYCPWTPSDFEQLPFLGGQHLVDLCDVVIGDPLEVLLLAAQVIFGDLTLALQVLHLVLHVAPDVSDGHPALLCPLTSHLDQLLAPVLGEGREGEPDDGPVVGR